MRRLIWLFLILGAETMRQVLASEDDDQSFPPD
jgi:hypothetical protein